MYDAKFMPNLCAGALVLVVLLLVGNCGGCCGICGGCGGGCGGGWVEES